MSQKLTDTDVMSIKERIKELEEEINNLPGWGAGVSVRLEEIIELKRSIWEHEQSNMDV